MERDGLRIGTCFLTWTKSFAFKGFTRGVKRLFETCLVPPRKYVYGDVLKRGRVVLGNFQSFMIVISGNLPRPLPP